MEHNTKEHTCKALQRAAACLLALAMIIGGAFCMPPANAVDLNIDGTGFTDPTITEGTMYYWHKGLPPAKKDGTKYPVLIVWNNDYFWSATSMFHQALNNNADVNSLKHQIDNKWGNWHVGNAHTDNYHWFYKGPWTTGDPDSSVLAWGKYITGSYYPMPSTSRISELPFDINVLRETGTAASMQLPDIPYVYGTGIDGQFAMGYRYNNEDRWLLPRNWLLTEMNEHVEVIVVVPVWVDNNFYSNYSFTHLHWNADSVKDYLNAEHKMGYKSYWTDREIDINERTWSFQDKGNGKYNISGLAYAQGGITRTSGSVSDDQKKKTEQQFWNLDSQGVSLGCKGNNLVCGWNPNLMDSQLFEVFYAEPVTISYIQHGFTVQNGQVSNLDGPIGIGPNAVIIVEDGGVLSLGDLIINNGVIAVQPGGTLIIKDNDTANKSNRHGVLGTMGSPGTSSGRIACDGTMIVMPNCTVCAAGLYGLQFGEGSQCVNYGSLISENFTVYSSGTIDNRSANSTVFAGYGQLESGFALTAAPPSAAKKSFGGMGNREATATVCMPSGAVYGKYASNLFLSNASTVTNKISAAARKGYVSNDIKPVDPLHPDETVTPDDDIDIDILPPYEDMEIDTIYYNYFGYDFVRGMFQWVDYDGVFYVSVNYPVQEFGKNNSWDDWVRNSDGKLAFRVVDSSGTPIDKTDKTQKHFYQWWQSKDGAMIMAPFLPGTKEDYELNADNFGGVFSKVDPDGNAVLADDLKPSEYFEKNILSMDSRESIESDSTGKTDRKPIPGGGGGGVLAP